MEPQSNRNSQKKTHWQEQRIFHNPRTVSTQILVKSSQNDPISVDQSEKSMSTHSHVRSFQHDVINISHQFTTNPWRSGINCKEILVYRRLAALVICYCLVIVAATRAIASVVCCIVPLKDIVPFMSDLTRAATSPLV